MRIFTCIAALLFAAVTWAIPYHPTSFTVNWGTELSTPPNDPTKLGAVDAIEVMIQSVLHPGNNRQTTEVISFYGGPSNVAQGTPATVTVWMYAPVVSLGSTPNQQIALFNAQTGAFDVIDVRPTTAFTNFVVVQIADVYPYITAGGSMRLRTTMTWPAGSPFQTNMDYQEIDI